MQTISNAPKYLPTAIITLIICVFGLVCQGLCLRILFHKDMTKSSYTFLLQGLAISDLLLLTVNTLRIFHYLTVLDLSHPTVETILFLWDWMSTSGTQYYTVAVAFERFCVVTYPLQAHRFLTLERAKICSAILFVCIVCLTAFSYVYRNYIGPRSFDIYAAVVLYFVPFILVLILYIFVLTGLRKVRKLRSTLTSAESSENSTTKMLLAVLVVFGICTALEIAAHIWDFADDGLLERGDGRYEYIINHFADVAELVKSSLNFLLYVVWGKRFRHIVWKVFTIRVLCRPCILRSERGATEKIKNLAGIASPVFQI